MSLGQTIRQVAEAMGRSTEGVRNAFEIARQKLARQTAETQAAGPANQPLSETDSPSSAPTVGTPADVPPERGLSPTPGGAPIQPALAPLERDIYDRVSAGQSIEQIAQAMGRSTEGVRNAFEIAKQKLANQAFQQPLAKTPVENEPGQSTDRGPEPLQTLSAPLGWSDPFHLHGESPANEFYIPDPKSPEEAQKTMEEAMSEVGPKAEMHRRRINRQLGELGRLTNNWQKGNAVKLRNGIEATLIDASGTWLCENEDWAAILKSLTECYIMKHWDYYLFESINVLARAIAAQEGAVVLSEHPYLHIRGSRQLPPGVLE
jgi:DNA-binding CsgD family transcriptional regulator